MGKRKRRDPRPLRLPAAEEASKAVGASPSIDGSLARVVPKEPRPRLSEVKIARSSLTAPLPASYTTHAKDGEGDEPPPPAPFMPALANAILKTSKNTSTIRDVDNIISTKIRNRNLMLENDPKSLSNMKTEDKLTAIRKRRESRKGVMRKKLSSREKKAAGLGVIEMEARKYILFVPLHKLWLQYMTNLLGSDCKPNSLDALPKIYKADFHGAVMTVTQSKCPNYIGITGIMVKETMHTFQFITRANKLVIVPKIKSVFSVVINSVLYALHGEQFKGNPAERTSRRIPSNRTVLIS